MKTVTAKIEGISPLQQGRYHQAPPLNEKEGKDDYEKRTWIEKLHVDKDGNIFIPPMALKKSLETAAKYLSISIPGQGKAKYNKHFLSGVLVLDGMSLGVKKEDFYPMWVLGNARGQRGASGARVPKCFPTINEWSGEVIFHLLDDIITEEVFERVLIEAGNFIGLGVFRPENGGYHGRFIVKKLDWN